MESTLEHLFNEIIETEKQVEEQRMQVIEKRNQLLALSEKIQTAEFELENIIKSRSSQVAKFIDLDIQLMELKCKCEAIENCKNEMKDQVNLLKKKTHRAKHLQLYWLESSEDISQLFWESPHKPLTHFREGAHRVKRGVAIANVEHRENVTAMLDDIHTQIGGTAVKSKAVYAYEMQPTLNKLTSLEEEEQKLLKEVEFLEQQKRNVLNLQQCCHQYKLELMALATTFQALETAKQSKQRDLALIDEELNAAKLPQKECISLQKELETYNCKELQLLRDKLKSHIRHN